MKILVCEDNILALKVMTAALEKQGFEVYTAVDGNEAMDKIGQKKYDLIILDIHLPFHSGLELVEHLRHDLRKKTPVIIISAFSDPQILKQAKELGVNDYFTKPVNAKEIISKVNSYLNKVHE